ncbi:MAG: vitamin K epoxide reductase family protein [Candidatus Roizmanbacteria bacterium]
MNTTRIYRWITYVSIFGLGLALYLLWQRLATPSFQPCSINATVNCDAVIKGPVSLTFGIPTSLYGLTGYICILIASFKKWRRVVWGVATFGVLFCLRITFIEIFQLHVICPVCLACQLSMIAVWGLATRLITMSPHVPQKVM